MDPTFHRLVRVSVMCFCRQVRVGVREGSLEDVVGRRREPNPPSFIIQAL